LYTCRKTRCNGLRPSIRTGEPFWPSRPMRDIAEIDRVGRWGMEIEINGKEKSRSDFRQSACDIILEMQPIS
jgi:hypothetical protein